MAHAGGTNATVILRLSPSTAGVIANWNSGVATSTLAGADLVTIGAANTNRLLHSLLVTIANLTPGAIVTVRLYQVVNGAEQQVYNQVFTQGVDPDGLWIVNGELGIHQALRVEVLSNAPADDGAVVDYDYLLENAL